MENKLLVVLASLFALLLVWGWSIALAQSNELKCIQGGLKSDNRDWISKETVDWCINNF